MVSVTIGVSMICIRDDLTSSMHVVSVPQHGDKPNIWVWLIRVTVKT
jgi:hypothetical protein